MKTFGGNGRSAGFVKIRPGGGISARVSGGPYNVQTKYGAAVLVEVEHGGKMWGVFLPQRLSEAAGFVKAGVVIRVFRPEGDNTAPYNLQVAETPAEEKAILREKTFKVDFIPRGR